MRTLYTNLIASLAEPIIAAYRAGNVELAITLLHNKIAEHASVTLAADLTRYVWLQLNKD